MCGIAALFSTDGRSVSELIGPMTDVVRHRGPDGEGFAVVSPRKKLVFAGGPDTPADCFDSGLPYQPGGLLADGLPDATVALGHRRLSIVDLAPTGHQPMSSHGNRYVIAFNGEVYNHPELREELEGLGDEFLSTSDTEVVLHAYHQWGNRCLHRLNGMFAFVIYDRKKRRLFAARDRMGIKPLYWWISPTGVVAFASEIKQFATLPGWEARLHPQATYDYLMFSRTDHGSETMLDGVRQVRGGEYVELDADRLPGAGGELPVRTWYHLEGEDVSLPFEQASERFRELFFDSVRLRLRADVPVGTGLSGGLDSSSIVGVTTEVLREADPDAFTNSFTACSSEARFDERPHVEKVLAKTGAKGHFVYPDSKRLFDDLDTILWHHDEPFPGTSIFAEWSVFDLVSTTPVKVTLDGHGADELLIGYHGFFASKFGELLKRGRWPSLIREIRAIDRLHPGFGVRQSLRSLSGAVLPDVVRQPLRRAAGSNPLGAPWLDAQLLGAEQVDRARELGMVGGDVNDTSYGQLVFGSLPLQLRWADRDSMAHSIESRVPFLDHRLVEFVLGCPSDYKLKDGWTKRILRHALADVLPDDIRTRKDKMGFVTAEEVWVTKDAPDRFLAEVEEAVACSQGVLTAEAAAEAKRIVTGEAPFSFFVFRVISFGRWMRRMSVGLPPN